MELAATPPRSPMNKLVHGDAGRPSSPNDLCTSIVDSFSIGQPGTRACKGPGGALKKRILRSVREERTGCDPINLVLASATKLVGKEDTAASPRRVAGSPTPVSDEENTVDVEKNVVDEGKSSLPSPVTSKKNGVKAFPEKLMDILERDDLKHAISWLPHGKAFEIPCPKRFTLEVLPLFFQRSEFSSFTRKLYYWGFRKITKGQDTSAFQHDLFQRGKKELCQQMRAGRVQSSSGEKAGKGSKKRKLPNKENVAAKRLQEADTTVKVDNQEACVGVLVNNNVREHQAASILALRGNARVVQMERARAEQLLFQGGRQAAMYEVSLQQERERLYSEHVAAVQARAKLQELSRVLDIEAAERLRREQNLRAAALLNMSRPAPQYDPRVGLYNTGVSVRPSLNLNGLPL